MKCPICGCTDLLHTKDHASHGVNEYVCRKCGHYWGN
jgi:predicted RNA-binding Zn-ribbon protein involved in translation (DUF1610 family)